MRTIAFYAAFLIPPLATFILMSSCKKCGPERIEYKIPENQKAFSNFEVGDSLKFKDELGSAYYLVCSAKNLKYNGSSFTGNANPCEDNTTSWEYLQTNFRGNLLTDNKDTISLSLVIGGT